VRGSIVLVRGAARATHHRAVLTKKKTERDFDEKKLAKRTIPQIRSGSGIG